MKHDALQGTTAATGAAEATSLPGGCPRPPFARPECNLAVRERCGGASIVLEPAADRFEQFAPPPTIGVHPRHPRGPLLLKAGSETISPSPSRLGENHISRIRAPSARR